MSYINTADESITIDGVPLHTPAWAVTDASDLFNGAPNRGADILIPNRRGAVARRRTIDATEVLLPVVVFGDKQPDGTPNTDIRAGLLANIDTLKRALRPNTAAADGTRALEIAVGGVARYARVHTSADLQLTAAGPGAARGVITLIIPAGVLRGPIVETTFTGTGEKDLNVGGTAEVYDSTITITGTAGLIQIANLTLDPTGATYLLHAAPVTGELQIQTSTFRSYNLAGGTQETSGYVTTGGSSAWLPLLPGTNTLRLTYNSPSEGITTKFALQAAWA